MDLDPGRLESLEVTAFEESLVEDVERHLDKLQWVAFEQGVEVVRRIDRCADLLDRPLALQRLEGVPQLRPARAEQVAHAMDEQAVDGGRAETSRATPATA